MNRLATSLSLFTVAILGCPLSQVALGQQTSVKPDINEPFENRDVDSYIERFERDGREVFDKREQIVQACFLKEGMDMADIGAGTGFLTRMFARAVAEKGTVWAVDISDELIEHIKKSAGKKVCPIFGQSCAIRTTPNFLQLCRSRIHGRHLPSL